MKTIKFVLLTAILAFGLSFTGVFAQGAKASADNTTAKAGETATVQLKLEGCSGFANIGLEVGYDSDVLTLVSVTDNKSVGATYTPAQTLSANPYNLGWNSTANTVFNGVLATFEFAVSADAAEGDYPITVSYYKGRNGNYVDGDSVNYDTDFNSLELSYADGFITVSNGTQQPDTPELPDGAYVMVDSTEGVKGQTVDVKLSIANCTGFCNLGVEVGYDSSVLTLTDVTDNKSVGITYTSAQTLSVNPYNLGWNSTANTLFNGVLAILSFKVSDDAVAGSYPITVSFYKGRNGNYVDGDGVNYDEDFNSLHLSYVNGRIDVKNAGSNTISTVSSIGTHGPVSFDVALESDKAVTGTLVAAYFDSKGKMLGMKSFVASETVGVSLILPENCSKIKIMWLDGMSKLKPLAECKTISVGV